MVQTTNIGEVILALNQSLDTQVKRLVLDIVADLRIATPVDTGWARANWVPNIGSPITNASGTRDAVTEDGQQRGIAKVAGLYQFPQVVYITNNVPYISILNDYGTSKQAPAGFVQSTIQKRLARA